MSASSAHAVDSELSELATKLWALDVNRCEPGVHYKINKQGRITSTRDTSKDMAAEKLFSFVNEDIVFKMPTYHWLRRLLDNYELDTGVAEVVTSEELLENQEFLNAVLNTKVMQEAHRFLVSHGKASADVRAFKQQLNDLWFKLYRRSKNDRTLDSCGFEHVFVGEARGSEVLGLHNWIAFYLLEKAGSINYNGYFYRGHAEVKHPRLLTLQFTFQGGKGKPIGGSFIGTSPEFEFALYTVCYLINRGTTLNLRIGTMDVEMTVYGHGNGIGTAYPSEMRP